MNEPNFDKMKDSVTLEEVKAALRLVCVSLPHLSGLAQLVRIHIDSRVSTMCIFQSGRLVVNPDWFKTLNRAEATFVMAHELLHLALKTHERTIESDPQLFNWAHDYIINDMLVESLGGPVPAGGLEWEGARQMSAESLIQQLGGRRLSGKKVLKISRGKKKNSVLKTTMAAALHGTGLLSDEENQNLEDEDVLREWYDDVLSIELEREWFPNTDPRELESACRQIRETAAKSVSLGLLKEEMEKLFEGRGSSPGRSVVMSSVLRGYYHTPWELALQRWMEAVTPGVRSYVRPSRRGADRKDVILPGRKREGWTLHIILDTSGSMSSEFNRVLGSIASFCESVNVDLIHVLQCDVEVTKDDLVTPEELQSFAIAGLGGSDMSKAMLKLAEDPEVEAVVILTDGYIGYPKQPMPYAVLWVLTKPNRSFSPSYGEVLQLAPYSD